VRLAGLLPVLDQLQAADPPPGRRLGQPDHVRERERRQAAVVARPGVRVHAHQRVDAARRGLARRGRRPPEERDHLVAVPAGVARLRELAAGAGRAGLEATGEHREHDRVLPGDARVHEACQRLGGGVCPRDAGGRRVRVDDRVLDGADVDDLAAVAEHEGEPGVAGAAVVAADRHPVDAEAAVGGDACQLPLAVGVAGHRGDLDPLAGGGCAGGGHEPSLDRAAARLKGLRPRRARRDDHGGEKGHKERDGPGGRSCRRGSSVG
jgi:hypothetical protein